MKMAVCLLCIHPACVHPCLVVLLVCVLAFFAVWFALAGNIMIQQSFSRPLVISTKLIEEELDGQQRSQKERPTEKDMYIGTRTV